MPEDRVDGEHVDVTPDAHLTYLIAKAAHVLELQIDDAVAGAGLTLRQFNALAQIRHRPGLSSSDLARVLLTTPQAVNTLITRLVAAGLVQKAPSRPRQPLVITLTDAGRDALARAAPLATRAENSALAAITPNDVEIVRGALSGLLERFGEHRRSRPAPLAGEEGDGD